MDMILPATLFATGALCATLIAIAGINALTSRRRKAQPDTAFPIVVIEDGIVIEANFDARRILDVRYGADALSNLQQWLSRHFGDVAELTAADDAAGPMRVPSIDGRFVAVREVCTDAVRVSVRPAEEDGRSSSLLDIEDMAELATLRANTGLSPFPLWRTNPSGEVIWINQAYLEAARRRHGHEAMRRWPIPHLFDEMSKPGGLTPGTTRRHSLVAAEDGEVSWFDCSVIEVEGDMLYTAMNIDEIVRAEGRLREVTQTLTKTFANLTIGLAVFGRQRNLNLFNPALTELTGLPVDFLTSRPALPVFLDRLREERMMPEPKDYKSWRDHLAQLEAEAVDGTFEETWTMPGGQTWRVTGRPHPDGAIAILFEDISLEMSLTRRFHREIDQGQEVIDALDDAIAVFGMDGTVVQTNAAYDRLWFADHHRDRPEDVRGTTHHWHKLTSPTPIWGDFRDFATETRDRLEWSADARLLDGRRMSCRFTPLSNGATLARFQVEQRQLVDTAPEMRRAI